MKFLSWTIRLLVFAFLILFALFNTEAVTLYFFVGQAWQAPLVVVLLAFFTGGAIVGVLSLLGTIYRQRRELAQLRRQVREMSEKLPVETPDAPPAA